MQFLQFVERNFPKERDMLSRVSIIEESSVSTISFII
jgi:starch phosphorylase